eukprot:TRINITY_DN39649_c0_g1_i1.p1 TRINITY_DN39649_c0_g1~~TRINITY_DN39649_c0_g1_i1.p1  ORF type:complete len:114 (+),score=11.41 TRINITY_DN39649_c0_g1_i1:59-400(+)
MKQGARHNGVPVTMRSILVRPALRTRKKSLSDTGCTRVKFADADTGQRADLVQVTLVKSFLAMREDLWDTNAGLYATCEECDEMFAVECGGVTGEPNRPLSAQGTWTCMICSS